jgi:hypothetical protein
MCSAQLSWKDAKRVQAPLPRRSKGPSAIAAASAAVAGPGSGAEDDSEPGPEPEVTAPPMSATAAAFVAELTVTPADQAAADTAKAALRPPAGRRLPRAALLAGAAVVGAALIGGAFLVAGAGDGDMRPSASVPGAVPDTTRGGGPYQSAPSRIGSAPPSTSPSADGTSASLQSPATGSATDGGTRTAAHAQPSATLAAGAGRAHPAHIGSGGSEDGTPCTPTAGSGTITDHSACASSGTVTFQATFNTSQSYYHVFINTDGDTATGYQLPYPSPSALGADYMIENGVLYRSLSTGWSWTAAATNPTMTVSGSTRTWTLPLSEIGSPTGTQQVEFNAGTDYTPVITFRPK